MPNAERILAGAACRNSRRNLRVSRHLDQPSRQYPGPALSSARSEGVPVDLVACATGRTLVELFATTVARRSHVGGYNEQSCYRPPAMAQPIGTDRGRRPRIARFVRGHSTCASWLL